MDPKRSLAQDRDGVYAGDALEAYRSFQAARTLFFWLLVIGLVGMAVVFWVVDRGTIDQSLAEQMQQRENPVLISYRGPWAQFAAAREVADGSEADSDSVEPVDPALPEVVPSPAPEMPPMVPPGGPGLNGNGQVLPDHGPGPNADEERLKAVQSLEALLDAVLRVCSYLITFAAVTYCLALLIGLKLSLVGRLGGLADGAKAFFVSLLVMVMLVPWQRMLGDNVAGVVFNLPEMVDAYLARLQSAEFDVPVLMRYYGRFVGLWGLSFLLLIVAQYRSYRSAKMVRARLKSWEEEAEEQTEKTAGAEEE